MRDRGAEHARAWAATLDPETRARLFALVDELTSGLDPSRHNPFGFLRLRAEFETSSEIFGCSLSELRAALAASLGPDVPRKDRPPSPLEALRDRIRRRGTSGFPLGDGVRGVSATAGGSTPGVL